MEQSYIKTFEQFANEGSMMGPGKKTAAAGKKIDELILKLRSAKTPQEREKIHVELNKMYDEMAGVSSSEFEASDDEI
jgi:hypothetical protein